MKKRIINYIGKVVKKAFEDFLYKVLADWLSRFDEEEEESEDNSDIEERSREPKSNMEEVRIQWEGPYLIERVPKLDISEEFGVYVITRRWGTNREKILYIGKTYWRDFRSRVREHRREWLNEEVGNLKVRLGIIKLSRGKKISVQRVQDIEALLIYWCQPRYNTIYKDSYNGRDLKIINEGRRGPIDNIITTDDI